MPDASSLARLMRSPDESLSTLSASLVCAPAKFRCAINEAMFVFNTDAGIAMAYLQKTRYKTIGYEKN